MRCKSSTSAQTSVALILKGIDMLTTKEDRTQAVAQANASAALEGHEPDTAELEQQQLFINGEISLEEYIASTLQFATGKDDAQ